MSLSDEIEVRIAGNLCQEVTLKTRHGATLATTIIAASPTALVDGRPEGALVRLALEVCGTANAVAFAARAGIGSRVIVRGRLEQRETTRVVELPRADDERMVAVRLSRQELVMVVERLLYVAPPTAGHVVEV